MYRRDFALFRLLYLLPVLTLLNCTPAAGQEPDDDRSERMSYIEVVGKRASEGTAANGYRSETATTTGPWGDRSLQDTPYSITVIPDDLIENVAARGVDRLFRVAPLAQTGQSQDLNGIAQATLRGFNVARAYVNGIQNNNLGMGVFAEEIERLEIMNGLSGFLYGGSPVGGVINYHLKRPTDSGQGKVTLGNYGGEQYYAHGDFGGPLGRDSQFGYRLNALYQNGDTVVDEQSLERRLLSGSLDWQPVENLTFYLNLSDKDYRLDGRQYQFFLGGNVPAPLDGTKLYAPGETFLDVESDHAGLEMIYIPTESVTVRSAYQRKYDRRSLLYAIGNLMDDETQYALTLFGGNNDALSEGGYLYLDWSFATGLVQHRLTFGVNGYDYRNRLSIFPNGQPFYFAPSVTLDLDNSSAEGVTVPDWDFTVTRWVVNAESSNHNLIIGDDIRFDEHWSMLIGFNRTEIDSESFDIFTGAPLDGSRYRKTEITPNVSILYRPVDSLTAYATYIESLEQGSIVGSSFANAGEILEPLVSDQYELGLKAGLGQLQLTAALFRIDKANERSDDGTPSGTFVQDGRQVHTGLELSAIGKPTEALTVMAGVIWMDNEVKRSSDPSIEGNHPNWVAENVFKLYSEYAPDVLQGWTVTFGAYYAGDSYQDPQNTRKVPSFTLFDIGARYPFKILGTDTEARVNVLNVTDEKYWAATSPGAPRTIAFSLSAEF